MSGDPSTDDPSTVVVPGHSVADAEDHSRALALTIEWHPDLRRIGASSTLGPGVTEVSRRTPPFDIATDVVLSRSPFLTVEERGDEATIRTGASSVPVEVEGKRLVKPIEISRAQLDAGVMLMFAGAIAVCLHRVRLPGLRSPSFDLVGGSEAIEKVRGQIDSVADVDVSVLIRGETGTGKDLVARAIATRGNRAPRPFVVVNMATLSPNTAADALFGHEKGAFTGASEARPGYFVEADGGTLFLDEIAATSADVQAMLLRVLEDGEVRPLGSRRSRKVDVRLIAATDADLEAAVGEGRFLEPLLHRLSKYQIHLPPLRQRRADIGPLLLHFTRQALSAMGQADKLAPTPPTAPPWLSATDFVRLAQARFPGNIRSLVNLAHQLTISSRGKPVAVFDEAIERLLRTEDELRPVDNGTRRTRFSDRTSEEIAETLKRNNYNMVAAALALGINRSTLYEWIRKNAGVVRSVEELTEAEVLAAHDRHGGNVAAMAVELRVSPKPLKARITKMLRGRTRAR